MAKVFTITEGLENLGAMKTGGQGSVYKGKRIGEIFTAIKILPTPIHSESAGDKNFTAFQNEVQKLKKVNEQPNPNVVKILSSGITDTGNLPFIEMEFIEGPDLEELLKLPHDPVFTIKEVVKVAEQLSHALAHCHKFGVRHGDIKSNNVKFNIHTGNYVLLDFGLAIMSDEQRRTSLRHAGAIEFMAPEQNDGLMLFETDVYGFGIILFELLAGTVPFPLKDNGETSRNAVMVAHMETSPPDLLSLRQEALPATWSEVRKEHEMQVPQWLVNMIYKCLEKKPAARFANGMEVHDYIVKNIIASNSGAGSEKLSTLQKENERLLLENEQLQQQLRRYQQLPPNTNKKGASQIASDDNGNETDRTSVYSEYNPPEKSPFSKNYIWAFIIAIVLIAGVYYVLRKQQPSAGKSTPQQTSQKKAPGRYKVLAARAYFYNEPRIDTRRNAYAIPSGEVLRALDETADFIYTEITNDRGQTSKGWLRKRDLLTLEEWNKRNTEPKPGDTPPADEDVSVKLNEARVLMNSNAVKQALSIYGNLAQQEVPEAMYEYGNLALQNKNPNISCKDAFDLITKASNQGYTLAKTTLGFLYSFADDENTLRQNNYDRCNFVKNIQQGSKLLIEAMVEGDSTASRLLDELRAKRQRQQQDSAAGR